MTKYTKKEEMADRISKLPSLSNQSLGDVIKGMYEGKPLFGAGGLLTQLVKDLTQISLQGEMDAHLTETSL